MQALADFFTQTAIFNAPKNTGRVPDIREAKGDLVAYQGYRIGSGGNVPKEDLPGTMISETMHQRQAESPLNSAFFSVSNREKLQEDIKQRVRELSGGKQNIDRQSDDDLFTIMRSQYLQQARNDPSAVAEELQALNLRVVEFSANRILVEVEAYIHYRKDQENFPDPIAAPTNANVQGTRQNELKSFF